jgi:hypothetical protein
MQIRTRMCMSADGYVTTPDGWPAQLADPAWTPEAFGFAVPVLDKLGLIMLPLLLGGGMQLTPAVSTDIGLKLESERVLATGAVEFVYACT